MKPMFDYDQRAPLHFQDISVEIRDGIELHDVSYANPNGVQVTAYLVVPHKEGHFAGVVILHGGEQDRSDFLNEALSLAKLGAMSLLIDEPSIRAMPLFTEPELDRKRYIQIILKLRRGVDVLLSRPNIDPERIGYTGLSFGAWMGGVLAGVEKRVKAFALIAGTPSMSSIWRSSEHPVVVQVRESLTAEQMESYLEKTSPLDAIHYISRASPSALLFQFARQDDVILERAALEYSQAASRPKMVKWYDAQHHNIFINAEALHDRIEWLRKELKLGFY